MLINCIRINISTLLATFFLLTIDVGIKSVGLDLQPWTDFLVHISDVTGHLLHTGEVGEATIARDSNYSCSVPLPSKNIIKQEKKSPTMYLAPKSKPKKLK